MCLKWKDGRWGHVREIKMEEVLFRLKKQESRPLTDVWSAWTTCLLANTPVVFSKSNSTFPKRGSGSWNFLKPLETCPAPRVQKKTHKMKQTAL